MALINDDNFFNVSEMNNSTGVSVDNTGSNTSSSAFDYINSGNNTGVYSSALIRDINTDGFLSSNPLHKPEYFVRAFDEPTYLTFKIEFMFHQNRNALFSDSIFTLGDKLGENYNNITYNDDGDTEHGYDYLPEAFLEDGMLAQHDNFATTKDTNGASPSYTPQTYTYDGKTANKRDADKFVGYYYSAEDYLGINRGEYGRARLMRKIKMILKDITENFPYYFKSIEGLDKLNLINPKAGYRLADDVKLTIKCYEGLDLKITQLIQMIRKVTWDDVYQRWVLPDIMRYFGMRIYVSEIRTFHEMAKKDLEDIGSRQNLTVLDFRKDNSGELRNATEMGNAKLLFDKIMNVTNNILTAAEALGNTVYGDTNFQKAVDSLDGVNSTNQIYQVMCISALNEVMPTICYECHMCEFDILNSMSEMSRFSSTSKEPQEQSISIKVRQVEDFQVYPLDRNLTINKEGNSYAILNKIYGGYGDDDTEYEQLRAAGFTGSTVFADKVFDEKFNAHTKQYKDELTPVDSLGNTNQTKLYKALSSVYDEALRNYFVNMGFNKIGAESGINISPRSKMYPGKESVEKLYNDAGPLTYKRNSIETSEGVMKLLIGGLNTVNLLNNGLNIFDNNFSRATGVTYNDLEEKLPELYVAARTLQDTMRRMEQNNLDDTKLGEFEFLNKIAYSKATKYTPIGQVASAILDNLNNPWCDINAYEERDTDANNHPIMHSVHVDRNWSTIAQDPDHNR